MNSGYSPGTIRAPFIVEALFKSVYDAAQANPAAALFAIGGITAFGAYKLIMAFIRLSSERATTLNNAMKSLSGIAEDKTDVATRELPETLSLRISQVIQPALTYLDDLEGGVSFVSALLTQAEMDNTALRKDMAIILEDVKIIKDQIALVVFMLEAAGYADVSKPKSELNKKSDKDKDKDKEV